MLQPLGKTMLQENFQKILKSKNVFKNLKYNHFFFFNLKFWYFFYSVKKWSSLCFLIIGLSNLTRAVSESRGGSMNVTDNGQNSLCFYRRVFLKLSVQTVQHFFRLAPGTWVTIVFINPWAKSMQHRYFLNKHVVDMLSKH